MCPAWIPVLSLVSVVYSRPEKKDLGDRTGFIKTIRLSLSAGCYSRRMWCAESVLAVGIHYVDQISQ